MSFAATGLSDVLRAVSGFVERLQHEREVGRRSYPGLGRVTLGRSVRAQLLLGEIQRAIDHQTSPLRPWQRYEPLSGFLDPEIWPTDQAVMRDLSFARLAIQLLSEAQRQEIEVALQD